MADHWDPDDGMFPPDLDLPPIVEDIGVALIEHGERGYDLDPEHPRACLCGRFSDYAMCHGPGVGEIVIAPKGGWN